MAGDAKVLERLGRVVESREKLANRYLRRAEQYRAEATRMKEVRDELARRLSADRRDGREA